MCAPSRAVRTGPAPAGPERDEPARTGQPRHYEASLRSAERFKVVVRDAKTRHPRLPGYLCTLLRRPLAVDG